MGVPAWPGPWEGSSQRRAGVGQEAWDALTLRRLRPWWVGRGAQQHPRQGLVWPVQLCRDGPQLPSLQGDTA